ncbi:MAG TPA: entericidin [Parvularcula sp.]|nr:entericidin [Parvularcula sp.]HBS30168.1 entericidin [Parvularcula sp.]
MKKLAIILAFCAFTAACETIKGVGRDIEKTGEVLDDAL